MSEPADDPHLGDKLLPALTGALGNFLYTYVEVRVMEEPTVHGPKASFF
jgi:hypothetical protein